MTKHKLWHLTLLEVPHWLSSLHLSPHFLKSMQKGPIPFGEESFSLWSLCMETKEHLDQRVRVSSPTMITWPPSSKEATVNRSAGRKLLAFHGEFLWLPRNGPLTSFTLPCTVPPTVLREILYLAISSCTLKESFLFPVSETSNPAFLQPPIHFGFPLELQKQFASFT